MNKDIDYFNELSYDVILRKKGDGFILFIPEISCLSEDKDLSVAYQKLKVRKQELFHEMIASDLSESIPEPERTTANKNITTSMLYFITKVILGSALFFLVTITGVFMAQDTIKKQLSPTMTAYSFVQYQGAKIKLMLEEMPESKKKELQLKIRTLLIELRPFLSEFKILWEELPPQS